MKKVGLTLEFPFGIYWWTLKNLKNQNFEIIKKNCWRYRHFTHVYQKPQSYEVQFLRYEVRQNFLSFWALLSPFNSLTPSNPEKQNFEKLKKASGHNIILNLYNKKHDHMIYTYSNMECNRHIFCHFRPFFAVLLHYWPQKL